MGPGTENTTKAVPTVVANTEELTKAAREEAIAATGAANKAVDPGPKDTTKAILTVVADITDTKLAKAT
jgi:hypothetical protein